MVALFRKISADENLTVKFDKLKTEIPAFLNISEESRRMEEMMRMYRMGGDGEFAFPLEMSLILNTASPLIEKLASLIPEDSSKAETIASYIYKLSLLSQRKLNAEEMEAFLNDGFHILGLL